MSDPPIRVSQRPALSTAGAARRVRVTESAHQGPRKLASPYPIGLLGQLANLPEDEVLASALMSLNQLHGGLGCVVFRIETEMVLSAEEEAGERGLDLETLPELAVPGAVLSERFLHAAGDLLLKACEPVALESARSKESIVAEAELAGGRCLVMAVPSMEGGQVTSVLCRAQELQHRGEAAPLAALQAAGLLRLLAATRGESRRIRSRFGKVAAFVELLGSASGGLDFTECARRLANHLRETVECETVALSLRGWRGNRLVAVSGESGPAEAHSPGRRALLAHLSEAILQSRQLLYRRDPHQESGPVAAPVAVPLREWFDPAVSLCLPLTDNEGKTRGGWLFIWKSEPEDFEEMRSLIRAAGPEVAPLLTLLHRSKPGQAVGTLLRLWKRGSLSAKRVAVALALTAFAAALLPLPYPVRATCELQPVVRRVIAAPFDGILLRSSVRAGELVTKGQLLAEMDGRELRSQLAEAVANQERAKKESDQALAGGHVAEARMAALEAEGLAHQIELLEYRREHLDVRSPIDGLVLRGDLDRSEGAPLRVGDPLFEVGPLDRLVAEIAVPATDVPLVSTGAAVRLKLESDANGKVHSTITRVAPKSEWIEDTNVFLCEAEIGNRDGNLRAGLKGKAKIDGPRRPLLWIWGRDAWLALRYHLW